MSPRDIILDEAAKAGRTLTEDQIDYVLWEETGFPDFWPDRSKTPEENLRQQVAEFLSKKKGEP